MHQGLKTIFNSLEICQRESVFSNRTITEWPTGELDQLLKCGLIRRSTSAKAILCYECLEYDEVVVLDDHAGNPIIYAQCSTAGAYEISADRLRQWETNVYVVMETILPLIPIDSRPEEIVRQRVWRLGKAKFGGAVRSIFFARGMHRGDSCDAIDQASFGAKSIVFTPSKIPRGDVGDRRFIPLLETLVWREGVLCLDHKSIESSFAENSEKRVTKRPKRKRASRTAMIEALTREMTAHIKSARDFAFTRIERGMEPELLPRPSKRQLAKQIDTSEMNVGNCFRDESARDLKFLWSIADDLEQLLRHADHFAS